MLHTVKAGAAEANFVVTPGVRINKVVQHGVNFVI